MARTVHGVARAASTTLVRSAGVKVLVTGGAGFIGSKLVAESPARGLAVRVPAGDAEATGMRSG